MAEISGLEVLALAKEIELALLGAYVNNIYSSGNAQLLRFRKTGNEDVWVVASPTTGVWVSRNVAERGETTELTTRLRRELERSRFVSASQVDTDRVFVLSFETSGSVRRLIIELMPPGNILVTDEGGKILESKNEVRTPNRRIVKGGLYSPPLQRRLSPDQVTPEEVAKLAQEEKTAGSAIGRRVAIPRKYVGEVLARLSLDEKDPVMELRGKEIQVSDVVRGLIFEAREKPRPCLCRTSEGSEIFVIHPKAYAVEKEFQTVSEICDELLLSKATEGVQEAPTDHERKQKELESTLEKLGAEEKSLVARATSIRTSAAKAVEASLGDAAKLLDEFGVKGRNTVSTPQAVASALYDHAKELEKRAREVRQTIDRLSRKSSKLNVQKKEAPKKLAKRKQDWYEKFRWFNTTGGHLAIGGRDAQSNSVLIRRHLEDNDVVYHADLFGSPFFVVKRGEDQNPDEVREVAQATVAFSSAWKTGLGVADAYWVRPDQVSTAAPSGEYLVRGSFAIKGKKNFVSKNIVEIAVSSDASGRVVAGPESAIRAGAKGYVLLRPQKEKSSETAKRVLKELQAMQNVKDGFDANLDEVLSALPPGGGRIVRKVPPGLRGSPVSG